MLEPKAPKAWHVEHPGRWVAEEIWPSPRIVRPQRHLLPGTLAEQAAHPPAVMRMRSPQITGTDCGRWGGYGGEDPDLPLDQRAEDGQSLCFDTLPLTEDIELLGAPEVALTIASDRPQAHLAVRLCDVAPNGVSALITYSLLNLTHRDGHEFPQALEPDRFYRVQVNLNDIARRVPKEHRLRLALATAHWPIVWPAPCAATLSLSTEGSCLVLPQRPSRMKDSDLRPFEPPIAPPPIPYRETRAPRAWRRVDDDLGTGIRRVELGKDYGAGEILDLGIADDGVMIETHEIQAEDPLSARCRIVARASISSAGRDCRIDTVSELSASEKSFELDCRIEAFENEAPVFARTFRKSIPRDFM
jgi:uncharacterized protein